MYSNIQVFKIHYIIIGDEDTFDMPLLKSINYRNKFFFLSFYISNIFFTAAKLSIIVSFDVLIEIKVVK